MSFNSCPVGIPDKEYMGKYYCYGNFCSFSCSARYIYEKESNTDYIKKYSMCCFFVLPTPLAASWQKPYSTRPAKAALWATVPAANPRRPSIRTPSRC